MQLLALHLFRDVMEFAAAVGKEALKTHVHQSLLPLLCHLHDENQCVAEVRISDLLVSPWEVARQHQVPEMGVDPLLCPGTEPTDGRVPQLLRLPTRGQERPRALPRCRGRRACALGSGAISQSLLLCRPLRKPCFKLPGS